MALSFIAAGTGDPGAAQDSVLLSTTLASFELQVSYEPLLTLKCVERAAAGPCVDRSDDTCRAHLIATVNARECCVERISAQLSMLENAESSPQSLLLSEGAPAVAAHKHGSATVQ